MIRFKVEGRTVSMAIAPKICKMAVLPPAHLKMVVEAAVRVNSSGQVYDGSYEVLPKVDGQIMDTKDKFMTNDVNIHPIPFFSVGNNSGGNTVYIGNEVTTNGN